jgi:hypothetical protein
MTKPKSITQKTFSPHLLAALGELVGYQAGKAVHFTETYKPVCDLMGISEDEYGQCESHDKPWTHRLIGLAFRSLRDKGLGQYEKKGYWALTQMGVQKAREAAGITAAPVAPVAPVVEETKTPVVHTAARTAVATQADVVRLPTAHPYHNDPYLRGLAIERTACFGAFSSRSGTCGNCPLSGECQSAVAAAKSKIAADLAAEDARKAAIKAAKEKAKKDKNESIDDLISSFDDDGVKKKTTKKKSKKGGKRPAKATSQREGICCECKQKIPKGEQCYWVKGRGIMHVHCMDD